MERFTNHLVNRGSTVEAKKIKKKGEMWTYIMIPWSDDASLLPTQVELVAREQGDDEVTWPILRSRDQILKDESLTLKIMTS